MSRLHPQDLRAIVAALYHSQNMGRDLKDWADLDDCVEAADALLAEFERTAKVGLCPKCGGKGYTDEGDPETGEAIFDCDLCCERDALKARVKELEASLDDYRGRVIPCWQAEEKLWIEREEALRAQNAELREALVKAADEMELEGMAAHDLRLLLSRTPAESLESIKAEAAEAERERCITLLAGFPIEPGLLRAALEEKP